MASHDKLLKKIKLVHFFFISVPIIFSAVFYLYFNKPVLNILSDPNVGLSLFNDTVNNGNSKISLISYGKEGIKFKYSLGDGYQFAYAGIKIKAPGTSYFDLSSYDYLKIKVHAAKGIRLPMVLLTSFGESDTLEDLGLRSSEYIMDMQKKQKEVKIYLNQFRTPDWWLAMYKKKELEMAPPDFSKVKLMQIQSCVLIRKNEEDVVVVKELSFHKDLNLFYLTTFFFSLAWYITGTIVLFRKNPQIKANITFNYEKTHTLNHFETEQDTVFSFITSHYTRQDLSIIDVQNETGISETKISGIIKNKTNLSFKQFLNKLRITESKRLLTETDLQISEVAYKVGYANISHFNRVFKEAQACTPNDFRKRPVSS